MGCCRGAQFNTVKQPQQHPAHTGKFEESGKVPAVDNEPAEDTPPPPEETPPPVLDDNGTPYLNPEKPPPGSADPDLLNPPMEEDETAFDYNQKVTSTATKR